MPVYMKQGRKPRTTQDSRRWFRLHTYSGGFPSAGIGNDSEFPAEKGVAKRIDIPDGIIAGGTLTVDTEAKTGIILHSELQFDIPQQLHLQHAAAALHRAENATGISLGNNDFPRVKIGVIERL